RLALRSAALRLLVGRRRLGVGNAPDDVADIICNEQSAGAIHRDADRPALRLAARVEKARKEIFDLAFRPTFAERDEHDFVANERASIPGAVLADEGAAPILLRED